MQARTSITRWARTRGVPIECTLELTTDCNLACGHCYHRGAPQQGSIPPSVVVQAMAGLHAIGCLGIGFSGGEPLLHPDFWALAEDAREGGFAIGLTTNGTCIGAVEADEMARLRFSGIGISLHGASADTHEQLTGVPGSFRRTTRAVRLCLERSLPVHVNCAVTRTNGDEMERLSEWCNEVGVRLVMDTIICDSADGAAIQLSATQSQLAKVAALVSTAPSRLGVHRCSAGLSRLAIATDGTVYPCPMYRQAVGSIHRTPVHVIWHDSPALAEVRRTAGLPSGRCAECRDVAFCPRCPGKEHTSGSSGDSVRGQSCAVAKAVRAARVAWHPVDRAVAGGQETSAERR